jgi:dephospho-CoA kinase
MVVEEFGRDILDQEGKINRRALGAIVFGNPVNNRSVIYNRYL